MKALSLSESKMKLSSFVEEVSATESPCPAYAESSSHSFFTASSMSVICFDTGIISW